MSESGISQSTDITWLASLPATVAGLLSDSMTVLENDKLLPGSSKQALVRLRAVILSETLGMQ